MPDTDGSPLPTRMNFHLGAKDFKLVHGSLLMTSLPWGGYWVEVTLDLNKHIGNSEGRLVWGSPGFASSSTDVRIAKDDHGWCPILYATCMDSHGQAWPASLNLAQCIGIGSEGLICDPGMQFMTQPVVDEKQAILYFRVQMPPDVPLTSG
ncbi:hypothetical protein N0V84_002367 [Fusarium piperis]|uniref:Cyanovirin-N domain-containing protein n=1 Tax=Fusarium piperis TaxID=1435070 RepID=A0A9W8WJC9_9HYPO|nr:hypothetical protein N0V84_002367 [Fusarium piperis]